MLYLVSQPITLKASQASMENFLHDAWSLLSEVHSKLELAQKAQEEDNNADEELNREAEKFVERIEHLIQQNGRMQRSIMQIIHEHNNRA